MPKNTMNAVYTCRITGREYTKCQSTSVNWCHLTDLATTAVTESGFTDLPWNLTNMVNAEVAPDSYPRFVSKAGAEKVVKKVQRFCGWLKAAAELRALSRVIEKTQSSRGMWSPRTTIHLWDFAEKHSSPGALERKLWAVRNRADAILSAYAGEKKPAWWAIAHAISVTDQAGKAAVIAVASTLSGEHFRMYRDARQWLVDLHLCKEQDESDGVIARCESEPRLVKCGVSVYRIAIDGKFQIEMQWLVRTAEGRTYHSQWGGPREALQDALRAWKCQDELAAKDADLVGFLNGNHGYCPLVVREDSYQAGNCSSGTEAWLRERGWYERKFIPAAWLAPHLDHSLVRNVALKLYQDLQGGQQVADQEEEVAGFDISTLFD